MNYARFYVGDYLRDTARLSMLEHGAYLLMLSHYYAEELPMPADKDEIYTIVRAMTPNDRKAVDKVLDRYFTLEADGYHNARADKEIQTSRQARANGSGGGRPPKTGTGTITGSVTGSGTGLETGSQTGSETGTITGEGGEKGGGSGHPPTTNLQPPATTQGKSIVRLAPDGGPSRERREAREAGKRAIEYLNAKAGTRYQPTEANLRFPVDRILADKATEADLLAVVDLKCRHASEGSFDRKYLRPETLWNATKFSGYIGQVGVSAPAGGLKLAV